MTTGEKNIENYLRKYLKSTKRIRTLEVLEQSIEAEKPKKPISLSFKIEKSETKKKITKQKNEKTKEKVPEEFKLLAHRFGLPKEHLQFFYDNRESFHWESMEKKDIHCTEPSCNFLEKMINKSLVSHMINEHQYTDIPCTKTGSRRMAFPKLGTVPKFRNGSQKLGTVPKLGT
ncbi:unnamed protein product [Oikopleura dioica]|uniref:Uncharacterized protein n=1 Tax=Oikopleura dioica TaxID=34765 RepID=E4YKH4_OIKDI|nr:unnamed protein product [Oikopleura dioica]